MRWIEVPKPYSDQYDPAFVSQQKGCNANYEEIVVRYVLCAAGVIALAIGLLNDNATTTVWLLVGAIFLAVGLATCEIVAAINNQPHRSESTAKLQRFRDAARKRDTQTMSQLMKDGGVPETVAASAAKEISEDPDRLDI